MAASSSAAPLPAADVALRARIAALELRAGVQVRRPTSLLRRIEELEASFRASDEARLRRTPLGSPVEGGMVTSGVSAHRFHPVLHRSMPHTGVDIAAPEGSLIHATADGVVSSRFANRSYGLGVDVDHGQGTFTRYAHMQQVLVRPGEVVTRGQVIGRVGRTGRVTGPHVHYEVFLGWRRVDAGFFLPDTMPVAAGPGGPGDY